MKNAKLMENFNTYKLTSYKMDLKLFCRVV